MKCKSRYSKSHIIFRLPSHLWHVCRFCCTATPTRKKLQRNSIITFSAKVWLEYVIIPIILLCSFYINSNRNIKVITKTSPKLSEIYRKIPLFMTVLVWLQWIPHLICLPSGYLRNNGYNTLKQDRDRKSKYPSLRNDSIKKCTFPLLFTVIKDLQ